MAFDGQDDVALTADRGYRDSVGKVEPYGVDHIPDVEKHGRAGSQFFVWFAAGLSFPIMVLGFSASYFGLSLASASSAVVVGALVGSVLMGVLSRMGVHLGIPQQMQARGPLGFVGNIPPVAYINVFAGIGWSAVNIVLGTRALQLFVPIPFWAGALIMTGVLLVVAVYGYNMIHLLQKILTFVLVVLFIVTTIVLLAKGTLDMHDNPHADGYIGAGGWVTLASWFLAFLVAWTPFASDYSRYLPDDRKTSIGAGVFTMLGNFLTMAWLGIVGVILATSAKSSDPIVALRDLMGSWATPALLAILISVVSQNSLNIYGGAISIQTLGLPFNRKQAVVIMCALAYAVSLYGASDIYQKFLAFLNLTSYFIAPYVAVILIDYTIGGRKDKTRLPEIYDKKRILGWGFVAWLVGVAASVPFWQSSVYVGPIGAAHPRIGDLSMFIGFAVALVAYTATYRLPELWTLKTAASTRPAGALRSGAAEMNSAVARSTTTAGAFDETASGTNGYTGQPSAANADRPAARQTGGVSS